MIKLRLKGNCMQTNYIFKVIIKRTEVARLFMIDCDTQMPDILPVGFAFYGHHYYMPLDRKRKEQTA